MGNKEDRDGEQASMRRGMCEGKRESSVLNGDWLIRDKRLGDCGQLDMVLDSQTLIFKHISI